MDIWLTPPPPYHVHMVYECPKSQSDEKVQLCCKHKQENSHGLRINRSTRRRHVLSKRYVNKAPWRDFIVQWLSIRGKLPFKNVKLPDLSFESDFSFKNVILTTLFGKTEI